MITHTDGAVGIVYKACQEAGYILFIAADHGNAEQMINLETGDPPTAHTTNPVSLIMTGDPKVFGFAEMSWKERVGVGERRSLGRCVMLHRRFRISW